MRITIMLTTVTIITIITTITPVMFTTNIAGFRMARSERTRRSRRLGARSQRGADGGHSSVFRRNPRSGVRLGAGPVLDGRRRDLADGPRYGDHRVRHCAHCGVRRRALPAVSRQSRWRAARSCCAASSSARRVWCCCSVSACCWDILPRSASPASDAACLDNNGSTRDAKSIMTVVVPLDAHRPAAQAAPSRVGVLLVNLGTPDTADAKRRARISERVPVRSARE